MNTTSKTPEAQSSMMTDKTTTPLDDRDSPCPTAAESPIPYKRPSHRKKTNIIFDAKECPWQALRDVVFMKQQLGLKNPDICKVLKKRYKDHQHIACMVSSDVYMMNDWWHDVTRPNSHLPLDYGVKDHAELALSIKQHLRPARAVKNLAPAPVPDKSPRKTMPKPRAKKRPSVKSPGGGPSEVHKKDASHPTGVSSPSKPYSPSAINPPAGIAWEDLPISRGEFMPWQSSGRGSDGLSQHRAQGNSVQDRQVYEDHASINTTMLYPVTYTALPYSLTSPYNYSIFNVCRRESNEPRGACLSSTNEPSAPTYTSLTGPTPPPTTSTFPTDNIAQRNHDAFNREDIPFNPENCPWHALRDAIFSKNEMDLTSGQVCLLLRYRYGAEYPGLRTLRVEDVTTMWDFCTRSSRDLYEANGRSMMQIEAELARCLSAAYEEMNDVAEE